MSTELPLKQGAVTVAVAGQYTLPNWYDSSGKLRTFTCRTSRVSPYQMMVDVPIVGKVGNHLTSYFREFGKLNGHIIDTKARSFLIELDVSDATRERLANKLTWLEEKLKDPAIPELRKEGARVVPENSHSTLTLADGAIHECLIIDMSVGGAAISAELQPPIGTALAVGACAGRVIRLFDTGFAVKFAEKRRQSDLDRLIIRSMPPHMAAARRLRPDATPPVSSGLAAAAAG